MGTTLTGTTPQDTYDSLIKVTDNGPLTGSLKKLTDGLGNDSSLSLSTTAASLSGTLAVTGNATFDTTTLVVDATNNRVGIGTSSPSGTLHVAGGDIILGASYGLKFSSTSYMTPENNVTGAEISTAGVFVLKTGVTPAERIRVDADGLKFNGDTAAANALDDYEEGTWTMGVSFGGASVGATYSLNTGKYTKIGRQVNVTGYLTLTSKGSSTGAAKITGLPFTIFNDYGNYSAVTLWFDKVTFTNQYQGNGAINSTTISLEETTILGVGTPLTNADFANDSAIIVNFTYFIS
jgi:hypothetical protein